MAKKLPANKPKPSPMPIQLMNQMHRMRAFVKFANEGRVDVEVRNDEVYVGIRYDEGYRRWYQAELRLVEVPELPPEPGPNPPTWIF